MRMASMAGFDIASLAQTIGYLGIFLIVFVESGFFVGVVLPGDSLLFAAGFLAAQGYFAIGIVVAICFAGAVGGDSFGYALGRYLGPRIFRRDDSLIFNHKNLVRAQDFYDRHGGLALVAGRFIAVVRTFIPILAGVARMRYRAFLFFNVLGALLWAGSLPLLGFYLGRAVPDIERYIVGIVIAIVAVSLIPTAAHILKDGARRKSISRFLRGK